MTSVVSCSSVLVVTVPRQPEYSGLPTAGPHADATDLRGVWAPVARLRHPTARAASHTNSSN